ncbi:unnamed protein product [Parnassius mnemosyne]|uniref:C2 domain-containing protein n=1 Tax=Parnassius mnemosyne TaxID=213953 RepID=A0AAV1M8Q1_9NEOP
MSRKSNVGKKGNLSQFGLLDIPDLDEGDEPLDLSDDDVDLEAELAAISGGGGGQKRPKKPAPLPTINLDAMIAESLKDIPSDEDEGSGDDDDPELLGELRELADEEAPPSPPRTTRPAPPPPGGTDSSMISLLQDRISNYTLAEKSAKQSGESSRARRFGRGLKTLNDLLKQAKAGKPIKEEDIPPPVSLGKPASEAPPQTPQGEVLAPSAPSQSPTPALPEPVEVPEEAPKAPDPEGPPPLPPRVESQAISPERQQGLQVILRRKEEFKAAALSCKHAGDKALALEYLKVVKQFDVVVEAYKSGHEMDLSELPTPEAIAAAFKSPQKDEEDIQKSTEEAAPPEPIPESTGLITASTIGEALKQRLAAFKEQEAKAKEQGNSSKARRMGRIVKQYEQAVKLHAAGKPLQLDELPTPAGHAPFPTDQSSGPAAPSPPRPAPAPPASAPGRAAAPSPSPAPSPAPSPSPGAPTASPSRYSRQLALLQLRQKQFKDAALNAKKAGNIDLAKEYLRAAKGFDSVIEAARGGLLVDLKSLPLPPQDKKKIEQTFDVVSKEDCEPADSLPDIKPELGGDVLERLQQQLTAQLKLCLANRDHCKAMGHVADTNRFENLATSVKQDLDVVMVAKSLGQNPPKFHYENREFSVVQCNTDLNENDLELTIVRGIAYNVPNPKDVDTYVRFEFPYPQEAPVIDRTSTVKDSNSPQYDAVFTLPIQRSSRPCLRFFKRHGIKFEVYSKGGWFSRDALLATAAVKLAPLETHVTLHDAFPLMDGRRPAGGSLEVKLRVRNPLLQQQVERSSHRWLVIDS